MRVLLVSSSSGSRGGGEIFLLYLAEALRAAGHTVALWVGSHQRMDELALRFSAFGPVLRSRYQNTYDRWDRGLLGAGRADSDVLKAWIEWQPDVIHLNKQNLEDGNDLLLSAADLPIPHLCTVHITQTAKFLRARLGGLRDHMARRALKHYRGPLVTVSAARTAELREFIGPTADIRTITNGVSPALSDGDRSSLRSDQQLTPGSFAFVAVGRLEQQKRPLEFLRCARSIRDIVPKACFHWIGSGRLTEEWDNEVARSDLHATVRRIDWCDTVRAVLPAYDLFLHTAAYEGLPLAVLEAMDAALPCAIDAAVHNQLPAALQACSIPIDQNTDWEQLLEDRRRLIEMGIRAQNAVRTQFSTTVMAQEYEKIYHALCPTR